MMNYGFLPCRHYVTLTPRAAISRGKLITKLLSQNMTEIWVQGWKSRWKFKGKVLVVKEPCKENDPNSECKPSKLRLTAKLCTKKE